MTLSFQVSFKLHEFTLITTPMHWCLYPAKTGFYDVTDWDTLTEVDLQYSWLCFSLRRVRYMDPTKILRRKGDHMIFTNETTQPDIPVEYKNPRCNCSTPGCSRRETSKNKIH